MLLPTLLSLFFTFAAQAEQDSRYYLDVHGDHHRYRHTKYNEGRYYEWTRAELSEVSICMEYDEETKGRQYRLVVDDVYCPKLEKTVVWSTPGHGNHSRCLEVDAETGGDRYRRLTDDAKCRSLRPKAIYAWVKTENDRKEGCYQVDAESRGEKFRLPAKESSCPSTLNPYVAFGRKEPLINPAVPYQQRNQQGGNRMPASLARPLPADGEEEEAEDEGIRKFWEDPEDMLEHVPGASRKGY